ncbi:MAG: acryloyl-CoA reductase [Steroidobacterales bacterium]
MDRFKVFRIHADGDRVTAGFEQASVAELSPGDVVIRVAYSSINYKDALAATGAGKILRSSPLVGGIDLSGTVVSSADPRYRPGDAVLVTGSGMSETRDGGYAEYARVPCDAVISMPPGLDLRTAMAVGTAGFAAALGIHKMELLGLAPGQGPVVVTGATGGVGTLAIDMLSARGHEVVAVSGKAGFDAYLRQLGAARILRRQELDLGKRPLERALWAGAVDNVGGEVLAWLTRTVDMNGSIASIGLAGGADLKTTVMPFILRGVNLLGVNSSATLREPRLALWHRIATDLKPRHFDQVITREIAFDELPTAFAEYVGGRVCGRTLVRVGT